MCSSYQNQYMYTTFHLVGKNLKSHIRSNYHVLKIFKLILKKAFKYLQLAMTLNTKMFCLSSVYV